MSWECSGQGSGEKERGFSGSDVRHVPGPCGLFSPNIHVFLKRNRTLHPRAMAPISTSRDHDVEAQRDVLQPHRASYHLTHCYPLGWNVLTAFIKVLEDDIHGRTSNPSEMGNETSRLSSDLAQTAILRSLGTALFTPALAFQVRRVILIPL